MPNDSHTLAKSRRQGIAPGPDAPLGRPVSADVEIEQDALALLAAAMIAHDPGVSKAHLDAFLEYGVSREEVIDLYIPTVARQYGVEWCGDQLGFSDVTIGTARLQSWLRELEPRAAADQAPLFAPEVLLVVPRGSYHTLGAMVAASQFRRLGVLVRIAMGDDPNSVGRMVRNQRFDMVAISASGAEKVEFLRLLINKIRTGVAPVPPVVIGGPILETQEEIGILTGADLVTSDPEEALNQCGLTTTRTHPSRCAPGS